MLLTPIDSQQGDTYLSCVGWFFDMLNGRRETPKDLAPKLVKLSF